MKMFPHPAPQPEPEIPLIDTMTAPEFVVTAASGMALINGLLTVTLESVHCDHSRNPPPLERIVVARMTMPVASAQGLLVGLAQFLSQHGLNPLQQPQETCQ